MNGDFIIGAVVNGDVNGGDVTVNGAGLGPQGPSVGSGANSPSAEAGASNPASDGQTQAVPQPHTSASSPGSYGLAMGALVDGSIPQPGASAEWSFEAKAGQVYVVDTSLVHSEGDCDGFLMLSAIAPSGRMDFEDGVGSYQCTGVKFAALETGTYRLLWSSRPEHIFTSLAFRFSINVAPEPQVLPLQNGSYVDGNIESLFAEDRWTFDAVSGQAVTVETVSFGGEGQCSRDVRLFLIAPSGKRQEIVEWVGNGNCRLLESVPLPETGRYALSFVGGGGTVAIDQVAGPYRFRASVSA